MLICIETHRTCDFPGAGVRTPAPSESAHVRTELKWYYFSNVFQMITTWKGDSLQTHGQITICLLMLSACNFCKQFGPRSGPTKCRAGSGAKLFDRLVFVFCEIISRKS